MYPRSRSRDFHEAEYLARFFNTIEINTSFYQPLRPLVARAWVRRVRHNPSFKFTAKLWQRFTHDRSASQEEERTFKEGLEPLWSAGLLGALLLQFPWSFKNSRENHQYLSALFLQFMEYPLVLEVRHSSWNQPEVFSWLAELGIGFCNIDQPIIGKSLRPTDRTTAPVGYVRLHGRNYEHWFTTDERPEERYNYLYPVAELDPWVERIRRIAARADTTFVITNNHFQGKGVTNALQLISLLEHRSVPAPETLLLHYPELREIALPPPASHEQEDQGDLLFSP